MISWSLFCDTILHLSLYYEFVHFSRRCRLRRMFFFQCFTLCVLLSRFPNVFWSVSSSCYQIRTQPWLCTFRLLHFSMYSYIGYGNRRKPQTSLSRKTRKGPVGREYKGGVIMLLLPPRARKLACARLAVLLLFFFSPFPFFPSLARDRLYCNFSTPCSRLARFSSLYFSDVENTIQLEYQLAKKIEEERRPCSRVV